MKKDPFALKIVIKMLKLLCSLSFILSYGKIKYLCIRSIINDGANNQSIGKYKCDGTSCQGGLAMEKTICELFAGVGGFRVGFDRLSSGWKTSWFSQWEPGKKKQWAHDCYVNHFGDSQDLSGAYTTGIDISEVDKNMVPDHTLLVGGFPCQDYSVAHSLSSSKGIEGKKGVLWWQIRDVLIAKRPPFVLLENVDRLLKSPASQRGRDFGIILTSFAQLGYRVEWRVVNAAEYGAAQRRRRTFIFAYLNTTEYAQTMDSKDPETILTEEGFMAKAFKIDSIDAVTECEVKWTDISDVDVQALLSVGTEASDNDLIEMTKSFQFGFGNAGYMINGAVTSANITPALEAPTLMREIAQSNVDDSYYIKQDDMAAWMYMKGAKKIERTSANGHKYVFSEGPIAFPDPLDKPSRTMLTSESTKNRSTHVVADPGTGRLRLITEIEAERLQGFDDNWTKDCLMDGQLVEMPKRMRYFCMGNALVVPMITRMGKVLDEIIAKE